MPWEDSWEKAKHYDGTDRFARSAGGYFNPVAAIWGAATGGDFDPITQGVHGQYGSAAKNASQIAWQAGDEDVYKQMDEGQWAELARKQPDSQRNWIMTRARWLKQGHDDKGNPVKPGQFWNPQTGRTEASAPTTGPSAPDQISQQMQDFYKRMTGPLDMNDPEVKQAIETGVNNNQRFANYSGVKGGLSSQGLARAAIGAQTQLAGQRRQMGLQALSMADSRDRGLAQTGLQAQGQFFDQNQSNALNAYNQNRANQQQNMAMVGQGLSFLGQGGLSRFKVGGGGGGGGGGGEFQSGGQNTPAYNGGGYEGANTQYGGSAPQEWSNPYTPQE